MIGARREWAPLYTYESAENNPELEVYISTELTDTHGYQLDKSYHWRYECDELG